MMIRSYITRSIRITLCYVFFTQIMDRPSDICLKFLCTQFSQIAETYGFPVTEQKSRMMGNILLKNLSIMMTPNSSKETKLKELKLS